MRIAAKSEPASALKTSPVCAALPFGILKFFRRAAKLTHLRAAKLTHAGHSAAAAKAQQGKVLSSPPAAGG